MGRYLGARFHCIHIYPTPTNLIQGHRRSGDLGILEFWDFPFELQVRQQFKSNGKIINQRASEGFIEPQIASKGLRGLQRASWGLREPMFFLYFLISSFFFTFLPLVLSPTLFWVRHQGTSPEVPEVPSLTPMFRGAQRPVHPIRNIGARASGGPGKGPCINNFQKIDFYRNKFGESCFVGESCFLTNMRVRNTILASKMRSQADFAPHKGPQGPNWALKGSYPKKFIYLILHNFFENSSGKYLDNQNLIEISLKLNFWDCFEIL